MSYQGSESDITRFILPAPMESSQEVDGIAWFEASASAADKRIELIAFTIDAREVGRAEVRLNGDLQAQATISGRGAEVRIDVSPGQAETDMQATGKINGQEFAISKATGAQAAAATSVDFSPSESTLVKEWSAIGHSLTTMAHAMGARRDSYGCAGCVTMGAGEVVLGVACIEGALPACGAFLVTWPSFVEHCSGACA